jgi:uncharacterized damage-inducible protein DinB
MMNDHYAMFAGYNAWANRRLYDAAAALPDAQYREDRGAFFKSMHGTLNHLLATDRSIRSTNCARHATPRMHASCATSTGWTMRGWQA